MKHVANWRLGIALIIAGALINIVAVCLLMNDREDLVIIFVVTIIMILIGLFNIAVYNSSLSKVRELPEREDTHLGYGESAIAIYIENRISDDILWKNFHYSNKEKENFYQIRIDRKAGKLNITARRRLESIEDPGVNILQIVVNLRETVSRTITTPGRPLEFSIVDLDVALVILGKIVRDYKFPEK